MKKERFVAFFDAVMAIVITISVLSFAQPGGAQWSDLKELVYQILVYALSFFWLAMMWFNIHNLWHEVESISRDVIWVNIFLMFFSSMIPFFVTYVGHNINEMVPQLLYGIDVICITVCNQLSAELMLKNNPGLSGKVKKLRKALWLDMAIKVAGVIICVTIFPPASMISVFIALIILSVNFSIIRKKHRKAAK